MIAMGAAALFGAVHADGIVSSDIVGYSTDSLTSGKFNMNAVVFNNIDGSDVDLNEDVTFANAKGGMDTTDSDTIQVWDATSSSYTTYALDELEGIWYDYDGVIETPTISSGSAFWYRSRGASTPAITQSGAVEGADTCPVVLTPGKFNMVVSPYPTGYNLNDTKAVTFTNAKGGMDTTDSDTIQVWDSTSSSYTTYALDELEGIWYDYDGVIEEPSVTAGTPYWYRSRGTSAPTITFIKNY